VCHSDLHCVRNEWKNTRYPWVPGHEIVGRVVAVGSQVQKFRVGELAGVGCMIDSCGHCSSCGEGLEQYCENGHVSTYNGHSRALGENTYGTTSSSSPPSLRCSAQASRCTRLCGTGAQVPARRSASSGWAVSATWG
jgi:Zn-dependent alcohol dehydrogenase